MFLNLGPIMPIYEYRCAACGFQKEYLQKMGDAQLTDCPECETSSFRKMVTAAGFQLKGSGWYATDFKNGQQAKSKSRGEPAAKTDDQPAAKSEDKAVAKSEDRPAAKSEDRPAGKSHAKPVPEAPAKKPDAGASPATSSAGASPA
jgi:putative FmdB family regulatory protein